MIKGFTWPPRRWWLQAIGTLAFVLATGHVLFDRFSLGLDFQSDRSLPWSVYLLDEKSLSPQRGQFVTFDARNTVVFEDGTRLLKKVAGVPGDRFVINDEGAWINGEWQGAILLTTRFGPAVPRDEIIPEGHYAVFAPNPRSVDSRYWGYLTLDQVTARAYPIW